MSLTQINPESPNSDSDGVPDMPCGIGVVVSPEPTSDSTQSRLGRWLLRHRMAPLLLRSLAAVLIGSLIMRIASQTMGQMVQFYLAEIDRNYYSISYTAGGLITASFFITELLGSLVLGALSDRYGRKVFMIGPLFGAVAVQLTSMTTAIWLLVITRLLEGLSTASSIPATLGYISEATSGRPKLRAKVVGLFEITLVGGIAVGAVVGGKLFKHFGQPVDIAGIHLSSPAFSINGLIYLASLAVFAWGLKSIKEKTTTSYSMATGTHRQLKHYRAILRSRAVWKFVPAWLAINSIIGLWVNHSLRLMTGKDHFTDQLLTGNIAPDRVGNVFALLAVLFAFGVLAWSFILARYRRTSIMLIAAVGLFVTLLTVYGLNHLGSFYSPIYYPLMGALLVGLLVLSGFTPAALTYLADVTEEQTADRGSIMGLYTVFLGVGQLIGIALGGKFATWGGIDGLLLLSALFGVVTLWSLILLRRLEQPATAV